MKKVYLLILLVNLNACGLDAMDSAATQAKLRVEETKQAQKQLDTIKKQINATEGAAARTKTINDALNAAQ